MKSLLTLIFVLCCTFLVNAQNTVGSNGPNGGNGTDMGKAYSNGNVPNPNEQTQNRPDSSLRSQDTTYMHQQWNADQKKNNSKRSTSNTNKARKTASTNKKKK